MVYLCWERQFPIPENRPSTLTAVFESEEDARTFCTGRAVDLAGGSGLITESMMSDAWDITDKKRRTFAVGFQAAEFGPVDSF